MKYVLAVFAILVAVLTLLVPILYMADSEAATYLLLLDVGLMVGFAVSFVYHASVVQEIRELVEKFREFLERAERLLPAIFRGDAAPPSGASSVESRKPPGL